MTNVYDFSHADIDGTEQSLKDFAGKVLLIVNVASKCGLTPHYKGLEELYNAYKDKGLVVLGFPCNQFGAQEPGTEAEIKNFCQTTYGVTFPMFSKLEVNGPSRHPLYDYLCSQTTGPDAEGDIQWNFAKFIINREGNVAARFSPKAEPASEELVAAIEKNLGA